MPADPSAALRVSSEALAAVTAHALADRPREAVGLLGRTAGGTVVRACPLANERTALGATGFLVRPGAFAAAEDSLRDAGLSLGGLYHSHPGRAPTYSTVDCRRAALGLPQLIVSVPTGVDDGPVEVRAWLARADRRTMDELTLDVCAGAGAG